MQATSYTLLWLFCAGAAEDLLFTINGSKYPNLHTDADYVKRECKEKQFCIPITHSKVYCKYLNSVDGNTEIQRLLRDSSCGFVENIPMVCCPVKQISTEPVCSIDGTKETCGKRIQTNFSSKNVAGGERATPGKWPWMALIGYEKERKGDIFYGCGGTLINSKTVLTAAHCIDKNPVVEVRLGDTDLRTEYDCLDLDFEPSCVCEESQTGCPFDSWKECLEKDQCAARHHIKRDISAIMIHPQYDKDTWDNDIGIITFVNPVESSPFISPVCLPLTPGKISSSNSWFVAGWGKTTRRSSNSSQVLQDAQVTLVSSVDCGNVWDFELFDSQICAKGNGEGVAVCEGDSGGPLLTTDQGGDWVQWGVVSGGSSICGDPNPSFFTLINQQIYRWIMDNMEGALPR